MARTKNQRQYPVKTEPTFIPPNTEDQWHQPWSTPVRQKIAGALAIALMTSGLVAPLPVPIGFNSSQISTTVPYKTRIQYQAYTAPVFVPPSAAVPAVSPETASSEVIFPRSIIYQSQTKPALVPTTFTYFNMVQGDTGIVFQKTIIYQTATEPIAVEEFNNFSYVPWSEPVRQKPGLRTQLQQSLVSPVFTPTENITIDKWFSPWSQPVRTRQLSVALQQSFTGPVTVPVSPFGSGIGGIPSTVSAAVQFPVTTQYQAHVYPVFVQAEIITVDKWIYAWSEPVRQKPGLRANLQQAFIGTVLNPNTQITQNYESRWHQAWSEPVRTRRFPAAEQQAFAFQPPSFEVITYDKWGFQWSEPVRQKPGLKAHLQQALIATTLNPETQIIQDFESRWHQAWSEPVRTRRFPTAEQQAQIQGSPFTFEIITVDKWIYPWSEPVRQKPGLRANLQQAFIAPVLTDQQLTDTIESRWHFAWSEPVRTRQLAAAQQQSYAAPATSVFETITVDKWIYQWSEPVRQKPGLRANLQQALIATTLEPNTQIIQTFESRWHQAWSEPVRTRRFPTSEQQAQIQGPPQTPEIITVDKWIYRFNEPVREKAGLKAHLQQAYIAPVLNPNTQITQNFESRWHQPWSEPTRRKRVVSDAAVFEPPSTAAFGAGLGAESSVSTVTYKVRVQYQSVAIPPPFTTGITSDLKWFASLSEPVRTRRFPAAEQQSVAIPPPFQTVVTSDIKWFAPLSEPVRIKIGLKSYLQRPYTSGYEPSTIPVMAMLVLSATEVNADVASFAINVYNGIAEINVSIEELLNLCGAHVSIKEIKFIDTAAASIEET